MVGVLSVISLFAVVLGSLGWAARRVRSRAGGGSLMNPFDEIWHPIAYHARLEIDAQGELAAPVPLPGDDPPPGPRGLPNRRERPPDH